MRPIGWEPVDFGLPCEGVVLAGDEKTLPRKKPAQMPVSGIHPIYTFTWRTARVMGV